MRNPNSSRSPKPNSEADRKAAFQALEDLGNLLPLLGGCQEAGKVIAAGIYAQHPDSDQAVETVESLQACLLRLVKLAEELEPVLGQVYGLVLDGAE